MRAARSLTRRSPGALVVVPLVVLALAGCSWVGAEDDRPENTVEDNESIGAGLAAELAERDDVASAEVRYLDTFTVPNSASVEIRMEPGADVEALYDEGLRLVWQSEINPISVIYVDVVNPEDPPSGISRSVDATEPSVREELDEKYGPHPD
ncbi:hypothetical protein [Blastococcus sp. TF02A-35]|uniref:hypothetical protein n=1 Tax=Blastococcus sp. TF02A-35 TaxID=2559612 RepID=UPI001073E04F|nr:hypothetical protein [Blastococcus sp. TF02A_35]TFV51884.1 hypothetical protein E4P43_08505 [Blastococcus sp. TF02A_35]